MDTISHPLSVVCYRRFVGSVLGTIFRVSTFGESHGAAVGAIVEGCPPAIPLCEADIQVELDRRRPGQSKLTSPRKEPDTVEILSGVQNGYTLGTPIGLLVRNIDARKTDYEHITAAFRPSHADFTYHAKYGVSADSGGGRASARETVARVAAGAIAQKALASFGITVCAWVESVKDLIATVDVETVSRDQIEATPVRCPDAVMAPRMIQLIEETRKNGDSVGGVVGFCARGCPVGWGDPVFDKLEADLAKAMLSLPAAKGFEIGSGFGGTQLLGSQHNDEFFIQQGQTTPRVRTKTNLSGGIQGGISNGETIWGRVAFKPTATILKPQNTVTPDGQQTVLQPKGRHDPCVLPRAVPIVESMIWLVLVDHHLRQRGQNHRG